MSTRQPTPTAPTRTPTRFTVRDAPRMFPPNNTDPCPQMFADKWTAREE